LFFAEKSGGIDLNLIADDLLSKARELMSEAQSDPNHPIRKFDDWMLDFAQQRIAMKIHELIQNLKECGREEKSYRTFNSLKVKHYKTMRHR
jgi:hypothetical protein